MVIQTIGKGAQILNLMLKIRTIVSTAHIAWRTVVVGTKLCGEKAAAYLYVLLNRDT